MHRSEYLLTSLKILRISENFLPPVVNPSHSANVGHLIDVRDKKAMNTENSLSRGHLISSNSNSTKDENEERIHRIVESNPNIGDTRFDRFDKFDHTKFQQTKLENKIFEQTKLEQLKFSRKKLCHLKKPFKSQERNFHSGILNNPDPEQRITEWL